MTEVNGDKRVSLMTRQAASVTILFTSPIILVFAYLGEFEQGLGVWACAGIVVHLVRVHWDMKKNRWFWMAIMLAILLQIPFVVFVPWSDRYMSMVSLLPFGILDYFIVDRCLEQADKLTKR